MKLKSTLSLLCVTGLMAMALAGCGSSAGKASAASAASNSANASSSNESSSSEMIGQVQSVSDKTVTLLLGDLTDAGQSQDGAPAVGDGSSSASLNSSPNTLKAPTDGQPSGSQSSSQQPGGQPSGQPGEKQPDVGQPDGGEVFTAGTETAVITLTDDTAIEVETVSGETEGSIDDVKEGSVLDVTLGGNNTATTIIVKNVMASNSEAPVHAGINTPAGSSSGSQSAKG